MPKTKKKDESVRLIELSAAKAKAALLKSESYFSFDLPLYFDFDPLLAGIDKKLAGAPIKGVWKSPPSEQEGVNHILYHSKDGRYGWRPMEIYHPVIYVALVDTLTGYGSWETIRDHFKTCSADPKIKCVSHPVISTGKRKDTAAQVLSWWMEMEQRSLEMSLDFSHVFQTDITDCYGAIYTHSICWALHGKELAKSKAGKADKSLLGNQLDWLISSSRHGQTNGIPQGSSLSDLIAEILLAYADMRLSAAVAEEDITDFKILRYRDDYRIFCNVPSDGERITKLLAEVLRDLGMKLSGEKTGQSDQIIKSSIKPDKLHWIGKEKRKRSLIKHALLIHELSLEYPNSGSVTVALSKFHRRLVKVEKLSDPVRPLIAVATDIALKNPRVYAIYAGVLSRLLVELKPPERPAIVAKIIKKFEKVPNCGHLHVWMQRFAIPMDLPLTVTEPLCTAIDDDDFQLWNSDWLPSVFLPLLRGAAYVDQKELKALKSVIAADEVELFGYDY
jgi:Reverse transcriptase (RNA-dependent DNA polymerase)